MKRIKSCYCSGPGMDVQNSLPGEFRSAAEAVLTWHMMDNIMNKLEELNPTLLYTFRGIIEMSLYINIYYPYFIISIIMYNVHFQK